MSRDVGPTATEEQMRSATWAALLALLAKHYSSGERTHAPASILRRSWRASACAIRTSTSSC